ncbi:hypothetical protein A2197_01230, partial [Candidatus Woesebacteria bacterium RIFOXYA1_FULL_48_16]
MAEKMANPRPFPLLLDLELTNMCNLHCAMCPTGRGILKRPKGLMSAELFGLILKEAARWGAALRFVRWGEPFVHPQCLAFCKLARSVNVPVWINTNGTLIDDEAIYELIHLRYGPSAVKFSFQGVTAEQYKKWRGKDNFEKLFETVGKLHKCRGDFETPYIQIGTTITDETTGEVLSFKARAEKISDEVVIGKTKQIGIDPCSSPNCPEVFDKLSVNWNGTVVACCADYDDEMVVGDLKSSTLKNIWDFGSELREIRENLANNLHNKYRL